MKNKLLLFLIVSLFYSPLFFSQNSYEKHYVTVTPGPEYEAGWLHEFFFGAHWRQLWATPLQVEVLDLDKFAGGLNPVEKGGGMQTKSLKFEGNDGRIWKFRSINKDPKKILPEEVQQSLVADIIQDQISTSNPLAPLIVAPFLDSVGILQSRPIMVLLPDDEKLGEFREEYGGLLGMIEIHPDEPEDKGDAGFANSDKISGTFKLFEKLEDERDDRVNQTEFLKARLIDIYLGDWDRHTDQWRWARYEQGTDEIWYPIPRDRDQAFSKYDGVFPAIASYLTPQLTTFGYGFPQVEDITWNARFLDRRFLTEINKKEWDSVAAFVHNKLTDELIVSAVKKMPPTHFEIAGEELISKLKSRRDKLLKFADDYYEFVNEIVEIFCTDKDDYVEINRLSDDETELSIYKLDKDTDGKKDEALYHKIFDNNLTKEFRINLLDGDDKVVISGEVDRSPLVRVIGDNGKDELVDNSKVNGYFLSFIPIPDAENKAIMYDHGDKTKIEFGPGTCWNKDEFIKPENDEERYEPKLRDRGEDWIYKPVLGYNTDDGLILGSGATYKSYNFRMEPLEYSLSFSGAYAFKPESYNFSFNGDFYSAVKNSTLNIDFDLTQLTLTKYYGFGNETDFNVDLEDSEYYRLEQELIRFNPSLKFPVAGIISANIGFSYNYSDISLRNDTLLSNFTNSDYGLNVMKLIGLHSDLEFDSRDNTANPYSGLFLKISGAYYPEVFENKSSFVKAGFDLRTYITTNIITEVTLALRGGGEKLFKNYPFFKAAFLGGGDNLRGYNRERFSGDASLFGQAELRFFLTDLKLLINGRLGFFGFAETGRVFVENEKSEKWHPSYGGGLWMSYLNRLINLNFALAKSEENLIFYFLTKFMF